MTKYIPKFATTAKATFFSAYGDSFKRLNTDKVPYTITKIYKPEFKVADGVYMEVYDDWHSADRTRIVTLLTQHPEELIIAVVLVNPDRLIQQNGIMTHSNWCEHKGVPWFDINDAEGINAFIAKHQK